MRSLSLHCEHCPSRLRGDGSSKPILPRRLSSKLNTNRLNDRQESYHNPRGFNRLYGDTFLTIDTDQIMFKTTNAELAAQITTRKNDFVKPVHQYSIIDVFGRSIVTVEGQDWRRHRKVVGPSFSEKSNKLVFEESLRQARGMMELWASQGSNTLADIKVENTAVDTADLSLHVICAAGFGLPQLWPGESKEKLKDSPFPEAGTQELEGKHALTFKQSIHGIVRGLRWLVVFPPWVLSKPTMKVQCRADQIRTLAV
jgi:cytochrome P450